MMTALLSRRFTADRAASRHAWPLLVLTALAVAPVFSQTPNLPLDHWAYRFLDRLEVKQLFVTEDFNTRPLSREAIADLIRQVDARVKRDSSLLTGSEWALFEQLKGEFYEELTDSSATQEVVIQPKEYEPHLFTWRGPEIRAHFDLLLGQQFRLENKQPVNVGIPRSLTTWGAKVRVNIKKSLAIYFEGRSFILSEIDSSANTVFNPSLGLPITKEALHGVAVTDNASAYAVFRLPWFDLQVGRDLVKWGPGYRGNLTLSKESNYYDLFKLTFRYKAVKFEYLHGWLNAAVRRYVAAHRLEIRLSRDFYFAINESVVYGNRGVEPLYLNPFFLFMIAERHLGNRDNNTMGFDGVWFIRPLGLKLYGEALFDDFSFTKNVFTSWANKWAVLLGGYWVDPLGLRNTDLHLEFVRIQPFVYSHRFPVNTYSNYNRSLGHWLGPDADDWYLELGYQPHRNLRAALVFEQRRKGPGNDFNKGQRPPDGKMYFLRGIVERNRIYGLTAQVQLRRDWFFRLTYHYIQTRNLRLEPGNDQNNHRLLINFEFDF